MRRRAERGVIAVEWVAAVTLLLLPAVVLVATLPTWAERRHTATVAAREAARTLERAWPNGDPETAELVAAQVALDHGVGPSELTTRVVDAGAHPGDQIRVEVRIRMPALAVPGLVRAGSWSYTAVASVRVDDYRSR